MSVRKRTWATSKGEERSAWIVQYLDADGVDRIKTFKTKGKAKNWEAETHTDVRKGTHVVDSQSITVKEAAEEWINAVAKGRHDRGPAEASTLRQCRYHVDNYIVPKLGRWKLSRLTKDRVMSFRDDLLDEVSRPLARKILTSLKGILSEAIDRGKLAVNVASPVKIGDSGRGKKKVTVPKKKDVRAILDKLDELASQPNQQRAKAWRKWRALIATARYTGMRQSEVRGLDWTQVGLNRFKIDVTQKADENGVIGKVKTDAGERTLSVPSVLINILRELKLQSGGEGLVFKTSSGKPQSAGNIYNRAWAPVQLAAGVTKPKKDEEGNVVRDRDGRPVKEPRYNFHALRHFYASLLIDDGANPKEVQADMGHSSIQITYDLYGHLFQDEEADKRRADRAERLAAV